MLMLVLTGILHNPVIQLAWKNLCSWLSTRSAVIDSRKFINPNFSMMTKLVLAAAALLYAAGGAHAGYEESKFPFKVCKFQEISTCIQ